MNANRILTWCLIAGIAASVAVGIRQEWRIREIASQQRSAAQRHAAEIEEISVRSVEQTTAYSNLTDEIDSLKAQISDLSRYVSRFMAAVGSDNGLSAFDARINPQLLAPGVYVLAPNDADEVTEESRFTVYHLTAAVGVGEFTRALQFGIARSGFTSWQFYFDYDNDGQVDTDMMDQFIGSIPFADYLSQSFDASRSQRVYDRFLRSTGEAEYTSPQEITSQGSEITQQMWSFVANESRELAIWIESATQGVLARGTEGRAAD